MGKFGCLYLAVTQENCHLQEVGIGKKEMEDDLFVFK